MEEKKIFKVTSNPILRTPRGTRQIMLDVIIGLIPALAVAVYMFGANVVLLLAGLHSLLRPFSSGATASS